MARSLTQSSTTKVRVLALILYKILVLQIEFLLYFTHVFIIVLSFKLEYFCFDCSICDTPEEIPKVFTCIRINIHVPGILDKYLQILYVYTALWKLVSFDVKIWCFFSTDSAAMGSAA